MTDDRAAARSGDVVLEMQAGGAFLTDINRGDAPETD